MSRVIALLTDFGTTDTYVGVMKGVMLGIAPDLQFVDLTHAIEHQNIRQAAFILLNSYRFFPPETIFLVVVDPGVGSSRKPIAVQAGDYSFVAPDNGVLSYALREIGHIVAVELDNPAYRLPVKSNTFHGRDIFAPAAAYLATGISLDQLGHWLDQPIMLPEPRLVMEGNTIRGKILHIDHFGSLITSIGLLTWGEADLLTLTRRFRDAPPLTFPAHQATVVIGDQQVVGIRRTYAEVAPGAALALVGSSGYLEVAVNSASFRSLNVASIGDPVEVQIG